LWATYFGGEGFEEVSQGAVDQFGNVIISGTTNSLSQISSSNAHQTNFGGFADAFVAKLSSSGQLLWSTYLGGSGDDTVFGCTFSNEGSVYLTGRTNSTTSIATVVAHQNTYPNDGNWHPFLVKFNPSGIREWGTYYGGADGLSVCVDTEDNVFMAGMTQGGGALNLIATSGSHQEVSGTVGDDAFLVKFSSSGTRLWGTFYGGNGQDEGHACATDIEGSVYMTGVTRSTDAIATSGTHQEVFGGDFGDAFIAKFSSDGVRAWGTYFGGSGYDIGLSISVSNSSNIYLSGKSQSLSSISSEGAYQFDLGGGTDAFLAKFIHGSPVSMNEYALGGLVNIFPNPTANSFSTFNDAGSVIEVRSIEGKCFFHF